MNLEILTNQILAFMEHDEPFEHVVAGTRIADPGERLQAAERMAAHIVANTDRIGVTTGHHAVAHSIVEYWQLWQVDHRTREDLFDVALLGARIVRDVKLLADLLDHKVQFEHLLLLALQGRVELDTPKCQLTRGCTLSHGHSEPCLSADARAP